MIEKNRVKEDKEWDKIRYLAWSSGNFGKGKKPKDLFELRLDTMWRKEYKKDDEKALAAFDKYKKLQLNED